MNISKIPYLIKLDEALLSKAKSMGKIGEMLTAVQSIHKALKADLQETPEALERALVTMWTDGILYGNWPWTKI